MIELRAFESLGHVDHGWLDARHHFSFGDYRDRNRMGWGRLRVWNDDRIAPGAGFAPHPHRDMEIITYVRTGAISHGDNLGNQGRTGAGDVQVMSAGSGIVHSEHNREDIETTLFQIWIQTDERGAPPRWDSRPFPRGDRTGRFVVLASGHASDTDALPIRADARLLAATLRAGRSASLALGQNRFGYLVPSSGAIMVDGVRAKARDGVALRDISSFTVTAIEDSEILFVETA